MNYVDVKVTVWNRLVFSDNINMIDLVKLIEQQGLEKAIDNDKGFLESETIYETEEFILPDNNEGQSTIEIFENGELIWQNDKI